MYRTLAVHPSLVVYHTLVAYPTSIVYPNMAVRPHFCRLSVVSWWSHYGPLSNVGRLSHACRLSRAVRRLVSPRPVVQASSHVRCSFIDIACLRVSVLVYTSMPCLGTNRQLSLHLPTHALSHRTFSHCSKTCSHVLTSGLSSWAI